MMSNLEFPEQERRWRKIGEIFGVDIEILEAEHIGLPAVLGHLVVMRGGGAENGMLLFPDGSKVLRYSQNIAAAGYGFSTLDPKVPETDAEMEACERMLRDWGFLTRNRNPSI